MIGRIEDFELKEGNNFYDINIKFSVDFQKLSPVFIVKSLMKEEQKKLETLNKEEQK